VPGPTEWLRGYLWDKTIRRYRNAATGRIVSREKVIGLLDQSLAQREGRITKGVIPFVEGRCTRNEWVSRTQTLVKREYLQSVAVARGGWDRMTPADYGRIGQRLRLEYARLQGTAQDIVDGKCSLAQAEQRMHMALGRVRALAMDVERANQPPAPEGMTRLERRLLGQAEHCDDCVNFYQMGWQPAGTLPSPGDDSLCNGNCKCTLDSIQVPSGEALLYIGRADKGGPLLAGGA